MRRSAIFLGGPQGSGKTTAAKTIQDILLLNDWEVHVIKFADPIYYLANAFEELLAPMVGRTPNVTQVQSILQDIGDTGRKYYGNSAWVEFAKSRAFGFAQSQADVCIIFEDVRKRPELDLSKEFEAVGFKSVSMYFDATEETRKARLGPKYRANTSHSTESEVQEFKGQFTQTIDTNGSEDSKNEAIGKLLKDAGFYLPEAKQLADIVDAFNHHLTVWSKSNRFGANFEFSYDNTGYKKLKVKDAAPIESLPADMMAAHVVRAEEILSSFEKETEV
jgi:hypothetical protein